MRYTQREVGLAMGTVFAGCRHFIASVEAETEIRSLCLGTEESPILYCPMMVLFYYLNTDGALVIVETDVVTARPCYRSDDPRNWQDDEQFFEAHPEYRG